jgi:phosphatidate cytidylyltransferase
MPLSTRITATPRKGRNLWVAVPTALGLILVLLASVLFSPWPFLAVVCVALVLAIRELAGALATAGIHIPVVPVAVGAVATQVAAAVSGAPGAVVGVFLTLAAAVAWRAVEGDYPSAEGDTATSSVQQPALDGPVVSAETFDAAMDLSRPVTPGGSAAPAESGSIAANVSPVAWPAPGLSSIQFTPDPLPAGAAAPDSAAADAPPVDGSPTNDLAIPSPAELPLGGLAGPMPAVAAKSEPAGTTQPAVPGAIPAGPASAHHVFGGHQLVGDILATAFAVAYLPVLAALLVLMTFGPDGRWLALTVIALPVASDTGGYFAGSYFGKHKLAPIVSPKKTWEGLAGSAALGLIAGIGAMLLIGNAWYLGVILALGGVATATLGDLAESTIKRSLGIKDMGSLLPGHGGVLDRVDSVLITIPFAYLVFWLAGLTGTV